MIDNFETLTRFVAWCVVKGYLIVDFGGNISVTAKAEEKGFEDIYLQFISD
jgi:hypothetical protein